LFVAAIDKDFSELAPVSLDTQLSEGTAEGRA
jgi:hypothetical protein